ncbi:MULTISPECIES: metal-dependent hydrolase [Acidobacteriaceae]|uniref:metal-dependent hydrolase n=1 Tax=Acidobacteriaceae TaxID=204434 RepID=UPI00131DD33F|nr:MULTISPECIES: metal-dependent hydrolase [Acidobacteriaceae]MDW5267617.1 metal-dependent hydrolase [Edaphobacter sp.]
MDPFTHLMTGAVLARSGFNRKAAYATLAMTLAAEAPDLDTLWAIRGPIAAFQHHRGWTHTLLGLPLEAAVVVGAVYLFHRWRLRRKKPAKQSAPLRWGLLYAFALVALLSHLLLDWTNNYGIRPFFPFNPHWYAASLVFIFEPVIFGLLLIALIAPALFGLVNSEVGARKPAFRGRGWAIAALVAIVALWGWRAVEQQQAIQLALNSQDFGADPGGVQILRVSAEPYPTNPFHWQVIVDTPNFYQLGTVDTFTNTVTTNAHSDLFYKPAETAATLAAKQSWLGHVYLDWSQLPLVTQSDADPITGAITVTFRDLRFLYDASFMRGREHPPLSGAVTLDAAHRVTRMEMDGHIQH